MKRREGWEGERKEWRWEEDVLMRLMSVNVSLWGSDQCHGHMNVRMYICAACDNYFGEKFNLVVTNCEVISNWLINIKILYTPASVSPNVQHIVNLMIYTLNRCTHLNRNN